MCETHRHTGATERSIFPRPRQATIEGIAALAIQPPAGRLLESGGDVDAVADIAATSDAVSKKANTTSAPKPGSPSLTIVPSNIGGSTFDAAPDAGGVYVVKAPNIERSQEDTAIAEALRLNLRGVRAKAESLGVLDQASGFLATAESAFEIFDGGGDVSSLRDVDLAIVEVRTLIDAAKAKASVAVTPASLESKTEQVESILAGSKDRAAALKASRDKKGYQVFKADLLAALSATLNVPADNIGAIAHAVISLVGAERAHSVLPNFLAEAGKTYRPPVQTAAPAPNVPLVIDQPAPALKAAVPAPPAKPKITKEPITTSGSEISQRKGQISTALEGTRQKNDALKRAGDMRAYYAWRQELVTQLAALLDIKMDGDQYRRDTDYRQELNHRVGTAIKALLGNREAGQLMPGFLKS